MSATTPDRKPRDIYEWAGGSAVNYEPVVIPVSVGHVVDAGLLPPETPGEYQWPVDGSDAAESEPEAEDDIYALGQRLLPGNTTVAVQEVQPANRVVDSSGCPRCGQHWDGDGVCPEHQAEADLVDGSFQTTGGGRR